jgi:hypothetical protein
MDSLLFASVNLEGLLDSGISTLVSRSSWSRPRRTFQAGWYRRTAGSTSAPPTTRFPRNCSSKPISACAWMCGDLCETRFG